MSGCSKLLKKAKRGAAMTFDELCRLLRCFGFQLARQRGSHALWKHDALPGTMINSQRDKSGDAKKYQIKQVLEAIAELPDEEEGQEALSERQDTTTGE